MLLSRSTSFGILFRLTPHLSRSLSCTMSTNKVTTFEVVKSPFDDRMYRGLELGNKLKVMLVSDSTADKAGAALDVHIGSLKDPKELPGLAHFCEHMLFLGTEKFPDENAFGKYLGQHGGSSNAYTSGDHTNYYFDIIPDKLEGALDRFSQFFVAPLFNETSTDNEVMAVHLEHEKNIPSDPWRIKQLEKFLSDPNHDYHKFGTGNKQTLNEEPKEKGLNIRDELLKFHQEWYSSNIMGLAVLGKQSLDELEALVLKFFTPILNKSIAAPSWTSHPYTAENNQTKTFLTPVKDLRNLYITFPIPDQHDNHKFGAGHYLGSLIGHEGKGSLLSELKARNWVNSLTAGVSGGSKGYAFFIVYVDLTVEGLDHVDDIIELVFQYIQMLKEVGPLQWVFEEVKSINNMSFKFKEKQSTHSCVSSLASDIHYYPMEEVLFGPYELTDWRPDLVTELLNLLVPDTMRVMVIAQKFNELTNQKEPWYGTDFLTEKIPEASLSKWKSVKPHPNLAVPPKNEFIPSNFELVAREENNPTHPMIIKDSPVVRMWFKQDDEFLRPKGQLKFLMRTPKCSYMDPRHENLTVLFIICLKDDLNEYAYDASVAGLSYSLSTSHRGILLCVGGYSEKQCVLLEKILEKMTTFKINPQRFEIMKESYERSLRNSFKEQPHQQAVYYNNLILGEREWPREELLDELDDISVAELQHFVAGLFSRLQIEGLVHGNFTENEALAITDKLESIFQSNAKTKPLCRSQIVHLRQLELKKGSHSVLINHNEVHKSSCVEVYYQCYPEGTRRNVVLELLSQLIKEPCFDTLRTKEQLGYIVFSGVRRSNDFQGLRVIVQSDRHPCFLDKRVESFLESMVEYIESMSDEEFDNNREALAQRRLEKPKKLGTRNLKFWSEISSRHLNFDRDNIEVEELRQVTKAEVLELLTTFILKGGSNRKKLATHIVSKVEGGAESNPEEDCKELPSDVTEVVEDTMDFKARHFLNPLQPSFAKAETFFKCKKTD